MTTSRTDTATDYAQRVMRVLLFIQRNLDRALPLQELAAIALDAGYETHESFTRAFGRAFGCSPSAFRKEARSQQLDSPADVHLDWAGRDSDKSSSALHFEPLSFENRNMKVEIRAMQPRRVLYLRHVGPYNEVGATWEHLCDWAGQRGLIDGDTRFLGASYDDPDVTAADNLRYDACLTVPDSVAGEGAIGVMDLAGGRFAVTLHEGSYERPNESYAAIYGGWFAKHSFEPGPAPCLEYYLNSPEDTEPEDLLTEICVPILSV